MCGEGGLRGSGGVRQGGCAWQGSVHGRGVCGGGVCMARGHAWQEKTAIAVGGTHPTGMHSCIMLLPPANECFHRCLSVHRRGVGYLRSYVLSEGGECLEGAGYVQVGVYCRAIKTKGMVFRYTWVYSKKDTMAHTY